MSRQPNASFIGKENITDNTQASGIYTLSDVAQKVALNEFPPARFTPSRSLRFDNTRQTYLQRTFTTPTNLRKWTWSGWIKMTALDVQQPFMSRYVDGNNFYTYGITSEGRVFVYDIYNFGSYDDYGVISNARLRDTNAWYHIVISYDTTLSQAADRFRVFVNGALIQMVDYYGQFYINYDSYYMNVAGTHRLGYNTDSGKSFEGYMTEINYVDGQGLDASSFGEFDSRTNEWKPKRYTGTYGNNGFYLSFANNSSTTTLGLDDGTGAPGSGAGSNDWTLVNHSLTAGGNYDSFTDVPLVGAQIQNDTGGVVRGNYCTLSAVSCRTAPTSISNGGLTHSGSTDKFYTGSIAVTTGKFYYEYEVTGTSGHPGIGVCDVDRYNMSSQPGDDANSWGIWLQTGDCKNNNVTAYSLSGFSVGDRLMVAFDVDSGKIWWGKNGTWGNSGNPGTGSNPAFSNLNGRLISPVLKQYASGHFNFGQRPFTYTIPVGFKSLCTTNLAEPTIKQPKEHFDIKLWKGNTQAQTIGNTARATDNYQISRSLRFRYNAPTYLERTPSVSGNRRTWTYSTWVKFADIRTGNTFNFGLSPQYGGDNANECQMYLMGTGDGVVIRVYDSGGSAGYFLVRTTTALRNVGEWNHIVVAVDTTHAVATNRVIIYVNGVRQPLNIEIQVSQNQLTGWNHTFRHRIGVPGYSTNTNQAHDGYLAEINHVDGQQLTPDSFGVFDVDGSWKPKQYTGPYGTNGFRLDFSDNSNTTATTLGKDRALTYYMPTVALNGTSNGIQRSGDLTGISNGKAGTVSMWWNFTGASSGDQYLWSSRNNSTIGTTFQIYRTSTGAINAAAMNSSGTFIMFIGSATNVCATAGLYHIYFTWDLSVTNKAFLYVNGSPITMNYGTFTNDTIQYSVPNHGIGGNLFSPFSPTTPGSVGQVYVNYSTYLDPVTNISKFYGGTSIPVGLGTDGSGPSGSAPIVYLDGDATSILTNRGTGGNFSAYGTLSTGNTLAGITTISGQNNFTPVNFSVATGSGNDSLVDVPTNWGGDTVDSGGEVRGNYATLNSLVAAMGNLTITNGALTLTSLGNSGYHNCDATISPEGRKGYFEITCTNTPNFHVGVGDGFPASSNYVGGNFYYLGADGNVYGPTYTRTIISSSTSSFTTNDVIMIAFDFTDPSYKKLWFGRNGTWGNSGSPSTGTNASLTNSDLSPTVNHRWYFGLNNGAAFTFNFGQRPFTYTPPTGFKSLNTKNLDEKIPFTKGPDLVWIKTRNTTSNHTVADSVRGPGREIWTSLTTAEQSAYPTKFVTDFTSNGFRLGPSDAGTGDVNINSNNYVGWCWNAGSTTIGNQDGAIGSSVRVNRDAGFSIVSYTGIGSDTNVGHGLGKTPDFIIWKALDDAYNWDIYHKFLGHTATLIFTASGTRNVLHQAPTDLTIPVKHDYTGGSAAGKRMIAYCWTEVPGYSKFGTYVGNGSSIGPFVHTGFRPRFILGKDSSNPAGANNWWIFDTARDVVNDNSSELQRPNLTDGDLSNANRVEILSNGFKVRASGALPNDTSGAVYVYAAFAEMPFRYALAR